MKDKLNTALTKIKEFFIDLVGFLNNAVIWAFYPITRLGIFNGYNAYWFANRYKQRREKRWHAEWDQMGRQQGIFPLDDTHLIVCSKMELTTLKKRKMINPEVKVRKLMKKSY